MSRIHLFIITFSICAHSSMHAQLKVKERSDKKQPEWIQSPTSEYIVSKGVGGSIQEAKVIAIKAAKKNILDKAVVFMLNENAYFKNIDLKQLDASQIFTSSAFYKNINSEKTEGFYWELLVEKKTKKETYNYYLKYRFTPEMLSGIVQKLADNEISVLLDSLNVQLNLTENLDKIIVIWEKAMFLNSIFPDTDKNKEKCEEFMQLIEGIFNKVEIKEMMNIPGKLVVAQVLNDKALISSKPPKISSNCASTLNTNNSKEKWIIDYSYEKCSSSSPHSITLEFDNGFNKLTKDFTFNTLDERMEVKMSDTEVIIKGNTIRFYVSSLYRKNLILDRIVLRYNDLNFTDTKLNQLLEGAGLYNISFNLPPNFNKIKIDEKVRGELYYHSVKTGQKGIYRFYNQSIKRK